MKLQVADDQADYQRCMLDAIGIDFDLRPSDLIRMDAIEWRNQAQCRISFTTWNGGGREFLEWLKATDWAWVFCESRGCERETWTFEKYRPQPLNDPVAKLRAARLAERTAHDAYDRAATALAKTKEAYAKSCEAVAELEGDR